MLPERRYVASPVHDLDRCWRRVGELSCDVERAPALGAAVGGRAADATPRQHRATIRRLMRAVIARVRSDDGVGRRAATTPVTGVGVCHGMSFTAASDAVGADRCRATPRKYRGAKTRGRRDPCDGHRDSAKHRLYHRCPRECGREHPQPHVDGHANHERPKGCAARRIALACGRCDRFAGDAGDGEEPERDQPRNREHERDDRERNEQYAENRDGEGDDEEAEHRRECELCRDARPERAAESALEGIHDAVEIVTGEQQHANRHQHEDDQPAR